MRAFLILMLALHCALSSASLSWAKEQAVVRVAANNAATLQKLVGKPVTVYGKVNKATVSRSGHHFLNFYSSNLTVVCFRQDVSKFDAGGPAKLWKNKEIEVSGKLELYKGKPQIKLVASSQIRLQSKPKLLTDQTNKTKTKTDDSATQQEFSLDSIRVGSPSTSSKTSLSTFELKQTGKLTWTSPAGLVYRGRDAEGLTRVEHVLRHAADQPNRQGSHGVFDGGNDQALAIVDEAWKLAKSKKIKPKAEGDRFAYSIPMGRRIGFLGGKTGARRNHPPLKKVFIVIRGKSEVITAFPR